MIDDVAITFTAGLGLTHLFCYQCYMLTLIVIVNYPPTVLSVAVIRLSVIMLTRFTCFAWVEILYVMLS